MGTLILVEELALMVMEDEVTRDQIEENEIRIITSEDLLVVSTMDFLVTSITTMAEVDLTQEVLKRFCLRRCCLSNLLQV